MRTVRTVAVVALLLCSVVASGVAAAESIGVAVSEHPDRDAGAPQMNETTTGNDTPRNDSLSGEVSSFMQITAASTEGAVDSGMWRASLNDTENETERTRMINARIEYLEQRANDIETETAELRADRNNSTNVSYVARASRLAARIEAFRTAVNQTAEVATAESVNETGANRLDEISANLTEPDLPAVDETIRTGPAPSNDASPSGIGTSGPSAQPTPASARTTTPTAPGTPAGARTNATNATNATNTTTTDALANATTLPASGSTNTLTNITTPLTNGTDEPTNTTVDPPTNTTTTERENASEEPTEELTTEPGNTTEVPATEEPITEESTGGPTEEPTTERDSTAGDSATEEPATDGPTTAEPTAEEPPTTTAEPTVTVTETATEESAEESATEEPTTDEPTSERSTEELTTE